MPADKPTDREAGDDRRGWPRFRLAYRFDNPVQPETVTVFEPGMDRRTTTWITADTAVAIPLEEVA